MTCDALSRIITVGDMIRGGACHSGVMKSATTAWPAAFTVSAALIEARRRDQTLTVSFALGIDGDGDGYGYGDGDGEGEGGE